MSAEIIKHDPAAEFYTAEGCFITELLNRSGNETLSFAKARVRPGITTALHRLANVTEYYIVLEGQGRVNVGDLPEAIVMPGDVVHIPADTSQQITNIGQDDLAFICVCTPRFTPECYRELPNEEEPLRQ